MNTPNQNNLTVEEAQKVLESFSCLETKQINLESEKALLRQALLLITSKANYLNLGICADSAPQGFLALETYLKALGYEIDIEQADSKLLANAVYIKCNTQKQSYYLETYTGEYRGVLISCQSLEEESINQTYGHLPLDLFI